MTEPDRRLTAQRATFRAIFDREEGSWDSLTYLADTYLFPANVRGKRVLDLGGARGTVALYLRLWREARVDVLDEYEGNGSAASNHQRLCARLAELDVDDMTVHHADARRAELPTAQYDHVVTVNCFHHIFERNKSHDEDVVALMSNIAHWLKPDGTFVLFDMSWAVLWRLVPGLNARMSARATGPGSGPMVYADKSDMLRWTRCAKAAGLIPVRSAWYVPHRLRRWSWLLSNRLGGLLGFGTYVVEFRKSA